MSFWNGTQYVDSSIKYGNQSINIGTSFNEALIISTGNATRLNIEISNTGVETLNQFQVSMRSHSSGSWFVLLNNSSHFSNPIPAGSILRAFGAPDGSVVLPTSLSANQIVALQFDLRDFLFESIRFRATTAANTTQLQFRWGIV